jgi:pyrroloquinoline-quinone synthase
MMEGLGFSRDAFDDDASFLHPAARAYRDFLRAGSAEPPWQAAVALLTIFVEGSVNERKELAGTYARPRGEDAVRAHPLVAHYGCPPSAMQLTRAHALVEGSHRSDAWRIVLAHLPDEGVRGAVLERCAKALRAWSAYRDGVAERMGFDRGADMADSSRAPA